MHIYIYIYVGLTQGLRTNPNIASPLIRTHVVVPLSCTDDSYTDDKYRRGLFDDGAASVG